MKAENIAFAKFSEKLQKAGTEALVAKAEMEKAVKDKNNFMYLAMVLSFVLIYKFLF